MPKAPLAALVIALCIYVVPADAQRDGDPPRERLGGRLSVVGTFSDLNEHFGNGYDFTLYFTERIWRPLNIEVQIGATYLGDLLVPELGDDRTGIVGINTDMRLAFLSLGPQYNAMLSETHTFYVSLGIGIYTVRMHYDTGIQAFDESSQSFGANGSLGLYWRITDNWNIDVNASMSGIKTGDDRLFTYFTNEGRNPVLIGIGLGLAMDLR